MSGNSAEQPKSSCISSPLCPKVRFMRKIILIALGVPLLALLDSCASPGASKQTQASTIDHFSGRNLAIKPGDDFFTYANGGWADATEIPADRSSYGVGTEVQELADKRTADLIQELAQKTGASGDEQRIADYYTSFMDEAAIEKQGLAPLQPELDAIAKISTRTELCDALGHTLRADVDILNATNTSTPNIFGLWVAQDMDNPSQYAPFLIQGGLGMPDRDYYVSDSPKMAQIRTEYKTHIVNVLKLAGEKDAEAAAERIFNLESAIAKVHSSRADTEDVQKGNNHWSRSDFDVKAPGLDWAVYFKAARLEGQSTFVVWQPQAVIGISALVSSESLQTWKDFLRYHALNDKANYLPSAFVNESFRFYGTVLSGTPKLRDRWKRGVAVTNAALGQGVGRLWSDRYFPESEKKRAEELVNNLIQAFHKRIENLPWMAKETKVKAQEKLATLKVGVGYPNKRTDYSSFKVVRGDVVGNLDRSQLFEYERNLKKLGQPVDREEWVMTPHEVNAVNLPVMNAIQFPAAILQLPFFGPSNTDAMNYGGIGAVIGHENSHRFYNSGAPFYATGRLHNWWTKDDFDHFNASGQALAKQYDAYKPFPDLAIHGEQTLAENIADLAGLAVAFDGFQLTQITSKGEVLNGLSPEQQFFVSYAQSWRNKAREPALRQQIITDGHAPSQYRVSTVRNLDAWYNAFEVKPGEALFLKPEDRVRVW